MPRVASWTVPLDQRSYASSTPRSACISAFRDRLAQTVRACAPPQARSTPDGCAPTTIMLASRVSSSLGASRGRLGANMHAPSTALAPHSIALAPQHTARCVVAYSSGGGKSWGEIGAEVVGVVKDVVTKIKDTATSAVESLTAPKPNAPEQRQRQQQDRRAAPLYRPREDERQLPLFPGGGGGLFGGLMGGLVNQAVKGLASQLEKAAQETRDVSEEAAARIRGSAQIQQRLGSGVTVGPAMSQSVSSSSINGRTTKTVTLLLPVYSAGGVPVAQAQVTQTQSSGQGSSCRVAVRMPEGDTLVLDDDEPRGRSRRKGGDQEGDVVEAEFIDLK